MAINRAQITHARYEGVKQNISASTTSAATASGVGAQTYLVLIVNESEEVAYVLAGGSTVTVSATTGLTLLPLSSYHLKVTPGQYIAAILAASTGTISVHEMTS